MAWLLAFGAHPDDVEFGCGGVILKETGAGGEGGRAAHVAICSRGEAATHGTPEERTREAEAGAKIMGATVEFLDLDGDGHLRARVEHAIRLAGVIRRVRPAVVLAPSLEKNQHPDHSRLGNIVRDACRLARYGGLKELQGDGGGALHAISQLFFYAITPGGEPREGAGGGKILVDVTGVMEAWVKAMEAHASQLKTRNYVEMQVARARVNGIAAGLGAAGVGGPGGNGHAIALWANDAVIVETLEAVGRGARAF